MNPTAHAVLEPLAPGDVRGNVKFTLASSGLECKLAAMRLNGTGDCDKIMTFDVFVHEGTNCQSTQSLGKSIAGSLAEVNCYTGALITNKLNIKPVWTLGDHGKNDLVGHVAVVVEHDWAGSLGPVLACGVITAGP